MEGGGGRGGGEGITPLPAVILVPVSRVFA